MNTYEYLQQFSNLDFTGIFNSTTDADILKIIAKKELTYHDFLKLLSPKAEDFLEEMAQKARLNSLKYFGKAILLYSPLYIADYCENQCQYCGYSVTNKFQRHKLNFEQIETEAKAIHQTGVRHIVLLTGDSRQTTPISYIKKAVQILKNYFDSITIEIYALTKAEYAELIVAGVDGLTIYQEVYDEEIYDEVHLNGPKKDYNFRLEAPFRGAKAGMHSLNIGALLGLNDWRKELFLTGQHLRFLFKKFSEVEYKISLPRLRPYHGSKVRTVEVSDKNLVQAMLAMRLYFPQIGINISTRESEHFRNNVMPLGVTQISAGVKTSVGGYSLKENEENQFEIADNRTVTEMKKAIALAGFQPIFKNWF